MPTKLILIRHGQTSWNRNRKYCGAKDIGLDAFGREQAKKLCGRLKKEFVHKIYASDKKRALQTARLAFGKVDIERVPGLREIHFGVFEGLTHDQVMKKYAPAYKKWLSDPFNITIPKGESLARFKKRIICSIEKIAESNKGKCVAVVCHGGAISMFINHIMKHPGLKSGVSRCGILERPLSIPVLKGRIFGRSSIKSRDFWKHIPSSASISVIEYGKHGSRIKIFNDTKHLE